MSSYHSLGASSGLGQSWLWSGGIFQQKELVVHLHIYLCQVRAKEPTFALKFLFVV